MSGIRNWNLEWLNHNSNRDYPLTVEASATSVDGDFRLPRDFIVAMYFSLNAAHNVDPARFTLKTVIVSSAGVTLVIGYQTEDEILTVATAMIPRDSHVQHQAYRLGGIGNYADLDGWVVIGKFDNMDLQPVGEWGFDIDGGRLELDVVRPQIRGVTRIRAQNGNDLSDPITGDIILRAGRNMRITPVVVAGQDPAFVFDAIDGEGLNEECICEGDIEKGPAIRSINRRGGARKRGEICSRGGKNPFWSLRSCFNAGWKRRFRPCHLWRGTPFWGVFRIKVLHLQGHGPFGCAKLAIMPTIFITKVG